MSTQSPPAAAVGLSHRRDQAAAFIQELIASGEAKPGRQLRPTELARHIGVSVTPVREALLLLVQEGTVVRHPNREFRVGPIRRRDISDTYFVYGLVAGELAARAASNATEDALAHLRALDDQLRGIPDEAIGRISMSNYGLHDAIYETANAPRLVSFVSKAARFFPHDNWGSVSGWREWNRSAHTPILDALDRRHVEAARLAMQAHVQTACELLLAHLDGKAFWADSESANGRADQQAGLKASEQEFPPSHARNQLRDRVAAHVQDLIVSRQAPPGRVLHLGPIADKVASSVTPVREALVLLAQDGWLVHEPNRGFCVAPIRRGDVTDAFLVYALCAGELAARAAERGDAGSLASLKSVATELADVGSPSLATRSDLDRQFYEALYELADSPRLVWFVETAARSVPWNSATPVWGSPEADTRDHGLIITALEAGSAETARDLTAAHVHRKGELLIAYLDSTDLWGKTDDAEPPLRPPRPRRKRATKRAANGASQSARSVTDSSVTSTLLEELHGQPQPPRHVRTVEAVLVSVILSRPSAQLAHAGEIVTLLNTIGSARSMAEAAAFTTRIARADGQWLSGIQRDEADERADELLALARAEKVTGDNVDALLALCGAAESEWGVECHPQMIGVAAAVLSDLGYDGPTIERLVRLGQVVTFRA